MTNAHDTNSTNLDQTIVGHDDLGPIDGPRHWKRYAVAGAFVAALAGGATFVATQDGGDADSITITNEQLDSTADSFGEPVFDEPVGDGPISVDDPFSTDDLFSDVPAESDSFDLPTDPALTDPLPELDELIAPILESEGPTVPAQPAGLSQICWNVQHQPVDGQDSASGIWVRGEVYGLDGGWIWVQGPTLNGGEPIEIPVVDGRFEAGLGINSFGDHEIAQLERRIEGDPDLDLLGQITAGDGDFVVPVDAAEGPAFESECTDFDPILIDETDAGDVVDVDVDVDTDAASTESSDAAADQPVADELETPAVGGSDAAAPTAPVSTDELAEQFFDEFARQHTAGDADALIGSLYPPMREAFGPDVCDAYVRSTTGSIVSSEVTMVGAPRPLTVNTPGGQLDIDRSVPVGVEFTLTNGDIVPNDANLVFGADGSIFWLTQCGVD